MPQRSPITVQRRANAFGVITVTRQAVSLGRLHAGQVVTVPVSDTTLTIDLDEGPRTVHHTTDLPIRNVKVIGRTRSTMFRDHLSSMSWDRNVSPLMGLDTG
ncbi:hypothetical protein LDL08_43180 [Nonomuraea glycinis]|uniref:Uncharacterized protein n=1 Tax=Nonomuraea glycinis TaxID=2047744 RepID=A0A918AE07_9ACTN|nr:hypothetical protein [Nonomuraea glycinis]MCA2182982.1 hypothetical protein [Nonomuraea glycinis]GGP17510.1 hypothetical protein GCM10012278_86330 [Nonomuraea glycinis]